MKVKQELITRLSTDIPDEQVLTMVELGAILRCDSKTATRLCESQANTPDAARAAELCTTGKIPGAFRIGTRLRITAGAVRAYQAAEKLPKNAHIHELRQLTRGRRKAS